MEKKNAAIANQFIYLKANQFIYLKIKTMQAVQYQPEQLITDTHWIIGTKLQHEKEFFLQIVDCEKKKQRLWGKLINQPDTMYFIYEIQLPKYLKPETPPF